MIFENAGQAVAWIEGGRPKSSKNGLENMVRLMRELGDPQSRLRMIHVAGTNGKGSVCAFCERMLRERGLRTGLYTSPYLVTYNERIRVDGRAIPDRDLVDLTQTVSDACDVLNAEGIYPTFFEIGTAIAFLYFARTGTDIAVIETGLGGRLDATNIISPCVSVITRIGLDHTQILGSDIRSIAAEKAGIVKPQIPCAAMEQDEAVLDVIRSACDQRRAPLTVSPSPVIERSDRFGCEALAFTQTGEPVRFRTAIPGDHQTENAALALAALEVIGFSPRECAPSIERTIWPCRLEWAGRVIIDGSHNPQGVASACSYVRRYLKGEEVTLVLAMMKDKDCAECAWMLRGVAARAYTASVGAPRSESPENLARMFGDGAVSAASPQEALRRAMEHPGIVLCTGSLYLAGEIRRMLKGSDGAI